MNKRECNTLYVGAVIKIGSKKRRITEIIIDDNPAHLHFNQISHVRVVKSRPSYQHLGKTTLIDRWRLLNEATRVSK